MNIVTTRSRVLPTRVVGVGFAPRVGLGAVDLTDANLLSAAQTLHDWLATNGCQVAVVPQVRDFQQAWTNAGGTLPSDTGGRSPIDGYYGSNTAAALQQLFNDAPAGCVGAAPSGGGAVAVSPTTASPSAVLNTDPISAYFADFMSGGTTTWVTLAVVGLAALAIMHQYKTGRSIFKMYPARARAGRARHRAKRRAHARRARRGRKSRRGRRSSGRSRRRRNPVVRQRPAPGYVSRHKRRKRGKYERKGYHDGVAQGYADAKRRRAHRKLELLGHVNRQERLYGKGYREGYKWGYGSYAGIRRESGRQRRRTGKKNSVAQHRGPSTDYELRIGIGPRGGLLGLSKRRPIGMARHQARVHGTVTVWRVHRSGGKVYRTRAGSYSASPRHHHGR